MTKAFDKLIYLQSTLRCNLKCRHCYAESEKIDLSEEQLTEQLHEAVRFLTPGEKIRVHWHGGEPTLLAPEKAEKFLRLSEKLLKDFRLETTIQTNLVDLSDEWMSLLLRDFRSEIGISYDIGTRFSSSAEEERFWKNYKKLQDENVSPFVVFTLTKPLFDQFSDPEKFFSFLEKSQIRKCHIEKLTPAGRAIPNWSEIGVSNLEYSRWMSRLCWSYAARKRISLLATDISPFDGLIQSFTESGRAYGCWSGECTTKYLTISPLGFSSGCTAMTFQTSSTNQTANCQTCDFQKVCQGGCPAARQVDASGECSGNRRLLRVCQSLAKKL